MKDKDIKDEVKVEETAEVKENTEVNENTNAEVNTQEASAQDFETTDGATEANVAPEKKKSKKSKYEVKIEELEAQVKKLKEETKKDREAYLLAKADLANVRKRVEDNAIIERKYASMNLVSDLIIPCDMLKKACSMETDDVQMKNFLIGFQMISSQIEEILKKDGLEEIQAKGLEFDANVHQAISKEHVEGVEPGQVIEVLQSGYKYKDRIIKPAMVKVSE